jgi:hypothetical protein
MCKKSFAMAAILMLVVWAAAAHADLVIYDFPAISPGTQAFTGSLGMDFDVNSPITITALGVFNSGQAGITGTLSAEIFNVTGLAVGGTLVSLTGTQGTLIDGSRFLGLLTPVTLPAGDYSIVSWGYSATDLDGNYTPPTTILNDDGGAISFVGSGRYSATGTGGEFPTIIDSGAPDHYYAGTFEVASDPPVVPLPSTALLLGTGLLGLVGLARRQRRAFAA